VSLHYSTHRTLSLDLDDLFDKVVVRSHGGYCMELNAFFGGILRALGFTVCSVGGRVRVGERYTGW
jgi:arylamine N-acetyltransferase